MPATRATPYALPDAPSACILICISGAGVAAVMTPGASVAASEAVEVATGRVFLQEHGVGITLSARTDPFVVFRVSVGASFRS